MCIQTIWIRKYSQEVPCGKCFECVKRRRNDWFIRCLIESRTRRFTYFGLLTYAEVGSDLKKRDIQLFLKRLRSYGHKLSYLIAGEYGEKKGRAHWHCLFFSDLPIPFRDISVAWRGGYQRDGENISGWIRFEPIRTVRSIRYTVKYLYKYDGTSSRFELMMSKNPAIGKSFVDRYHRHFLERRSAEFRVDGRAMALPRYYKRKFFDDYPDIKEEINSALAAKVAEKADEDFRVVRSLYPDKTDDQVLTIIKLNKQLYNDERRRIERGNGRYR